MSKQPPPAPTASEVGPCPTVIKIVGRPGTGSLLSTIAPPDHPQNMIETGIVRANECYSLRQARGGGGIIGISFDFL